MGESEEKWEHFGKWRFDKTKFDGDGSKESRRSGEER
jgi:hypothetical protein